MAFTYTAGGTDALDEVRLLIGDTVAASPLFQDEEVNVLLGARNSDIFLTAADACEYLAIRFARAYDIAADGQTMKRSDMAKMYREMAAALRARRDSVQTLVVTKVDGYSDDIPADEVQTVSTSPRRHYYGEPDRIPVWYDRDADLYAGLLLNRETDWSLNG